MLSSKPGKERFWWPVLSLLPQAGKSTQTNSVREKSTEGPTCIATGQASLFRQPRPVLSSPPPTHSTCTAWRWLPPLSPDL